MFKLTQKKYLKFKPQQFLQIKASGISDKQKSMEHQMQQKVVKKKKNVKAVEGIPYYIAEQEYIGKGCFGKVVRAYNKDDYNQQLVAKIIPLQNIQLVESMKAQIQVLKQLPIHPNLVNCKKLQICTQNNFYLIMQYCNGGSFEQYIVQNPDIQQQKIWGFLKQFCKGYQVLYDNQIFHRDIKPQNILIHNGSFKIADFGLAKKFSKNQKTRFEKKGTPVYMAPQLIYGSTISPKIDVFSLGIVLFRLSFGGKFPYGNNFPSIMQYVENFPKLTISYPDTPKRSQQLVKLIDSMLQKNPQKRISWQQIFEHPQIAINQFDEKENRKLTEQQMLQLDKAMDRLGQSMLYIRRGSVAQIKPIPLRRYSRAQISQHTTNLMELEMFMNSQPKQFQLIVWKGKILCLAICYVITKIKNILLNQELDNHISHRLNSSIKLGYLFAEQILIAMKLSIQNCQGQNQSLRNILSMIQSDEQEILKNLKTIGQQQQHLKYCKNIQDKYPEHLYNFLTQYWQFASQAKKKMKIVISILADIYDSGIRFFDRQFSAEQTNQLDLIPHKNFKGFASYLHNKQKISDDILKQKLKKLGLLFL